VADVLSRPRLRAKYPDLTDERRDQLLAVIRHVAEVLPAAPRTVTLACDPDDVPYLNLAVASGAAYLVTWDRDMLDLMQDAAFVARYPDLKILSPVELLTELTPPVGLQEGEPAERELEPSRNTLRSPLFSLGKKGAGTDSS